MNKVFLWILLLVLILFWMIRKSNYEKMGEYGTMRTLSIEVPGEQVLLPGDPAYEVTNSVSSDQNLLTQIQQSAGVDPVGLHSLNLSLPNLQVPFSQS